MERRFGVLSGEPGKDLKMVSKLLKQFRKDETGAAMVEYAIALLVAAALGTAVFSSMGSLAKEHADDACKAMKSTSDTTTCPQ